MNRPRRFGSAGSSRGFTLVEVLIIISIISLLAALTIIVYKGIQQKAADVRRQSEIKTVQRIVEVYYAQYGEYPRTTNNPAANWKTIDVRTDANCFNGSRQTDWVPSVTERLPQSNQQYGAGVDDITGCYLYASNGQQYVLSAWNMVEKPQTSVLYRRLGFREFQTSSSTQFYTCNSTSVGGGSGGSYDSADDYYKHSYTVSNLTDCDETPPPGA